MIDFVSFSINNNIIDFFKFIHIYSSSSSVLIISSSTFLIFNFNIFFKSHTQSSNSFFSKEINKENLEYRSCCNSLTYYFLFNVWPSHIFNLCYFFFSKIKCEFIVISGAFVCGITQLRILCYDNWFPSCNFIFNLYFISSPIKESQTKDIP